MPRVKLQRNTEAERLWTLQVETDRVIKRAMVMQGGAGCLQKLAGGHWHSLRQAVAEQSAEPPPCGGWVPRGLTIWRVRRI